MRAVLTARGLQMHSMPRLVLVSWETFYRGYWESGASTEPAQDTSQSDIVDGVTLRQPVCAG